MSAPSKGLDIKSSHQFLWGYCRAKHSLRRDVHQPSDLRESTTQRSKTRIRSRIRAANSSNRMQTFRGKSLAVTRLCVAVVEIERLRNKDQLHVLAVEWLFPGKADDPEDDSELRCMARIFESNARVKLRLRSMSGKPWPFVKASDAAECRVPSAECRVPSAECRVPSAGCRVQRAQWVFDADGCPRHSQFPVNALAGVEI